MSILDYRSVEKISCAGIPITTFLSDNRDIIMVSATDLVEQLCLASVSLEDFEGLQDFVVYDINGRQEMHYCVTHPELNEFLWMHTCSKEEYASDLDEFRKYFSYEVMSFWNRFAPAAASLSVRDALRVITKRNSECHETLGLPPGRVYQFAFEALGYAKAPSRDQLTTEELAFVTFSELLYSSVAASEQVDGNTVAESMRIADSRLESPLLALGNITRSI